MEKKMEQMEYRYWLANLPNIGVKKIERLLDIYGNSENIFRSTKEELYALKKEGAFAEHMSEKDLETITQQRDIDMIHRNYTKLINNGIYFVSREEDDYPEKLRNIFGAPYALYVKGRLPRKQDKLIAIVGARECSPYGKEMAKYLAGAIAKEGIMVISGLARGIDSYAHQGALTVGGGTYAIMGCGIDNCYPRENINLYMEMQKEGGIISEYAPGIQPLAGNFPMRNRIISGLSDGILIIEAKEKSGSLITVDYGLEQGKEIYALPGRATDHLSEGCNNLIKMGAKMVTSPKDILEDLLPQYVENADQSGHGNIVLSAKQYKVYSCVNADPKHIEEISLLTQLPMEQLMEQLLELELRGLIRQTLKNFYCKEL
jgi:DNA processing protein